MLMMYDGMCPECDARFKITPDIMFSERSENLHNGIYREHIEYNCPVCNAHLRFYAQYELIYLRCESEHADGIKAREAYSMDGSVDGTYEWREPAE